MRNRPSVSVRLIWSMLLRRRFSGWGEVVRRGLEDMQHAHLRRAIQEFFPHLQSGRIGSVPKGHGLFPGVPKADRGQFRAIVIGKRDQVAESRLLAQQWHEVILKYLYVILLGIRLQLERKVASKHGSLLKERMREM